MALEFRGVHQEILDDETSELDIEGARLSAKTWTISEKLRRSCEKYPGIWWLMCRYSGTETDNQLRPQFMNVCRKQGSEPVWHNDESAYWFPEKDGKVSKVFAFGLKTQAKDERFAKIRGSGFAGVWNDQSEELPEDIGTEMRALIRQPGYPHQLIYSPNPPPEEHFLADAFPEDHDLPGRKLYQLSIYQNRHNLEAGTIEKLEAAYPITHAKHRSLILGLRGPNITGVPVYADGFDRLIHVRPFGYDPTLPLLEGFDAGKHHPSWLTAQRSRYGAVRVLGGLIGKRLFMDDFLPLTDKYRSAWFGTPKSDICCDPPPNSNTGSRYTVVNLLREAKLRPKFRENGSSPDVRVTMIEHIGALMKRPAGEEVAFGVNSDPARWLMASRSLPEPKQTKLFVDGLEGSYVWDTNYVSVGNKTVRQPLFDQWLDGWQRCLENIILNFCAGKPTEAERSAKRAALRANQEPGEQYQERTPLDWAR